MRLRVLLSVLAAGIAADLVIDLSVLWTVIARGASTLVLGVCLSAAALVPYALERFWPRLHAQIARRPLASYAHARAAGAVACMVLLVASHFGQGWVIYGMAALNALLSTLAAQAIETRIAIAVLDGRLTPNRASRVVQMATQSGCFVAGLLVALLLERGGIVLACGFSAAVQVTLAIASGTRDEPAPEGSDAANFTIPSTVPPPRRHAGDSVVLVTAFVGLLVLSLQMSSENLLLVALVQGERGWSAGTFGLLDAMFCAGAFLGAFAMRQGNAATRGWALLAIGVSLTCWTIGHASSVMTVAAGVFAYGFCFNAVRVLQREVFFASASSVVEASRWAGRLASARMFVESSAPIALGLALTRVVPSQGYALSGAVMGGTLLVLQAVQRAAKRAGEAQRRAVMSLEASDTV